MPWSVRVEGLERVLSKLSPRLYAEPLRLFWGRATITIESRARENAPVDTGRLRASLTHEIDAADPPLWAKVGTSVFYAPYMEYGTGIFAEGPGGGGAHWPPGEALSVWGQRHGGLSGFAVAAAIGKRGGLEPRRYLRDGFRDSLGQIADFVRVLGDEIGDAWGAR